MDRAADHLRHFLLACALSALGLLTAAPAVQGAVAAAPSRVLAEVIPALPQIPPRAGVPPRVAALSSAIIVRWEIGSPGQYTRKWSGVYWPGGHSGPTWGIGYDGGHQSAERILSEWHMHPHRERLADAAGLRGETARQAVPRFAGITVPWPMAMQVFTDRTLPAYSLQAARALGADFEELPHPTQAALISLGYNRGWSMLGSRNAEKRAIRDRCLPDNDPHCVAREIIAMCRLWEGTPNYRGLCGRRRDEARLAVQP